MNERAPSIAQRLADLSAIGAHISIQTTEALGRDQCVITDGVAWLHPQTAHAIAWSVAFDVPMGHPKVQLRAALSWIEDRIERSARAATARLDTMCERFAERDRARAAVATECARHGVPSQTGHYFDIRDLVRCTSQCVWCGLEVTDETLALAGAGVTR